jgi:gliding motility-associated peptidyl-prolyl isomerase
MKNNIIFLLLLLIISSCSSPEARKPIIRKTSSFMSESVDRNTVLKNVEEEIFRQIMEKDSLNEYISSEYGFWYYYVERNVTNNEFANTGDEGLFSYEARSLDDNIVYSNEELGDINYLVDKEELITGLQEGIKLMKEGEVVVFLFPSYKAYGYVGNDRIRSNEPLIYTVKLKKIINKN